MSTFLVSRPIPDFPGGPFYYKPFNTAFGDYIALFFATANDIYQLLTMNTGGINVDLGPFAPVVEQAVK